MIKKVSRNELRKQRHYRVRAKVTGTAERPRLNVFRSSKHIYAQIIDDVTGTTLVSASTLDKDLNIKTVEVMDKNDIMQIKMEFNDIDLKATYADNYFDLKANVDVASTNQTITPVTKIEDIIYPMYMPENTTLTSQDTVSTTTGERVILTFGGEKPFMLVQETVAKTEELITIPVNGEPILFADTIGAKTDSSITWLSNGLEYYLVSDILTDEELVSVAKSVSALPVIK